MASKKKLLGFLDSRVFNPILRARKDDYKESQHKALADVQSSTKSEKQRFRGYGSAQEIRENYMSDLHSEAAKRINRELKRLKLPSLPEVKSEFLAIADGRKKSAPKAKKAGG